MRLAKSEATGQDVDLVKLAADHGAEAVEIADLHEAYKLLTGKDLPATVPVSDADMALDPATSKDLEKKYQEWQARLASEWATILTLDSVGRLPALFTTLRDYTKHYKEEAEQLRKKGFIGAAYSRMLYAWVFATTTNASYEVLAKVRAGNISGAVSTLTTLDQLDQNTTAVFEKIGALKPNTLGGHLQMMAGFKAALRSWVYREFATSSVQSTTAYLETLTQLGAAQLASPELADQVVNAVVPTVLYVGRTAAETALAIQQLDFEHEDSVKYMCSIPNVQRMSTSFQSAAVAGLNYFDDVARRATRDQREDHRRRSAPAHRARGARLSRRVSVDEARECRRHAEGAQGRVGRAFARVGPDVARRQRAGVLRLGRADREVLLTRHPHRRQQQGRQDRIRQGVHEHARDRRAQRTRERAGREHRRRCHSDPGQARGINSRLSSVMAI